MTILKATINDAIQAYSSRLIEIAAFIGVHPELGHEEKQASALLSSELESLGYQVNRGVLGLETAFIAEYKSGKSGGVGLYGIVDRCFKYGHGEDSSKGRISH